MSDEHQNIKQFYQNTNSKDWHTGLEIYQYANEAWRKALPAKWIAAAIDDISFFLMINSNDICNEDIQAASVYKEDITKIQSMYSHIAFAIKHSSDERFEAILREPSIYSSFMWETIHRIRFCMRLSCCRTHHTRLRILACVYKDECVYSAADFRDRTLQNCNIVFRHIVTMDDWFLYYHMLLGNPEHIHARTVWSCAQTRDPVFLEAHCRVLKEHNAIKCMKILKIYITKLISRRQFVHASPSCVQLHGSSVPAPSTKRKLIGNTKENVRPRSKVKRA